ncbi:MAG: cytochrome b/b6 domain-containing protein [Proteobacteria bacterium]|nr:cytochrome b/b6 domain-containing protein [Pseudomonadota bacterium]
MPHSGTSDEQPAAGGTAPAPLHAPTALSAPVLTKEPATLTAGAARSVVRHSFVTRLTHWLNALAMSLLLMSGLQIFNAHPALYWGDTGYDPSAAVLAIGDSGDESDLRGWLLIGSHRFDTTGILGVSNSDGAAHAIPFPAWATIPSWRDLATGRRWHFLAAWVLVLNGLLYLVSSVATGHLRRDLLPQLAELSPRNIARALWDHLRLRHPRGEAALRYNVLQKLAYVAVIVVFVPMIVLTGWAMSPGLNAAAPWLPELFGGRQSARLLHFVAANLLVLFVIVHLLALLAVGVWNELRAMITGHFVVPEER